VYFDFLAVQMIIYFLYCFERLVNCVTWRWAPFVILNLWQRFKLKIENSQLFLYFSFCWLLVCHAVNFVLKIVCVLLRNFDYIDKLLISLILAVSKNQFGWESRHLIYKFDIVWFQHFIAFTHQSCLLVVSTRLQFLFIFLSFFKFYLIYFKFFDCGGMLTKNL